MSTAEENLSEIESEIQALLMQVRIDFGHTKYKRVSEIIKPFLDESNYAIVDLYDFGNLSSEELEIAAESIGDKLMAKSHIIAKTCNQALEDIAEIL